MTQVIQRREALAGPEPALDASSEGQQESSFLENLLCLQPWMARPWIWNLERNCLEGRNLGCNILKPPPAPMYTCMLKLRILCALDVFIDYLPDGLLVQ